MLKDNPKYKLEFTSQDGTEFYALTNASEYHMSRYVAATAQNTYSQAGITPDLMQKILDLMIKAVNDNKLSDVAVYANNLKYRMKYPVDEHSILRMAMIYYFIEGEDPDKCENHWTESKLKKVLADPTAYSFFLPIGLELTPAYKEYLQEISQSSLQERTETLKAMTPGTWVAE